MSVTHLKPCNMEEKKTPLVHVVIVFPFKKKSQISYIWNVMAEWEEKPPQAEASE